MPSFAAFVSGHLHGARLASDIARAPAATPGLAALATEGVTAEAAFVANCCEKSARMAHATHHLEHVTATAADWGLCKPKEYGEDERKRPLAAVATDLNGRLKQCCKTADSPSGAALEMRGHLKLFARYGLPNPKAIQLVRDLTMKAFTPHKR